MRRPPSQEAVSLVAAWPGDAWLTAAEVEGLARARGITTRYPTFVPVLNEARRRSWLIRDQRQQPTRYRVTATGAEQAGRAS